MIVLKMDKSTMTPENFQLIEGYKSMIWTERFGPAGEFEMKTDLVAKHFNQVLEDDWITLHDSDEVMIVETKAITVTDDGVAELTIKGRSLESFLENRNMNGDLQLAGGGTTSVDPATGDATVSEGQAESTWPMMKNYEPQTAMALIIWNTVVDNNPVITGVSGIISDEQLGKQYTGNPNDILPGVVVTHSIYNNYNAEEIWLKLGSLYQNLIDLMDAYQGVIGIRSIRPPSSSNSLLSFDQNGNLNRNSNSNITGVRFDIYDGRDRTSGQLSREPVIFRYNADHLDDPSYTFTSVGKKNVMKIDSDALGARLVSSSGQGQNISGWNRRVGYTSAQTPQGKRSDRKYIKAVEQEGRRALGALRRQSTFDGKITENTPYKYRKHYFLGDMVTVRAQFGFELDMRVIEYIRTSDVEGDRGYPTLVL